MEKKQSESATPVLGDFDPRVVHYRDGKSGRTIKANAFRIHIIDKIRYYEHPVGSGNLYFEDRHPAGRMEAGKVVPGKVHIAWVAPETQDDKLAKKLAVKEQENAKLHRELSEIKKEQKGKSSGDKS